jgi:hemolysin activation/secretion protein
MFFAWLGQLRGVYRHPSTGAELRLRGDLQLADRSLLPLEQFSVGGPGSVRGYRRNQLVRDQGFAAALDLRIPVWRTADARPLVTLGPFIDVGRAWNRDRVTPGIRTLSSIGAALEWTPIPSLAFELEWAYGLRDVDRTSDLQDESVYFKAVWWAF